MRLIISYGTIFCCKIVIGNVDSSNILIFAELYATNLYASLKLLSIAGVERIWSTVTFEHIEGADILFKYNMNNHISKNILS